MGGGRFRVDATFTVKGRHYLCAVGAVLDGQVSRGMTARLEVAGESSFVRPIEAVEVASTSSGAKPTLVFRYPTDADAVEGRSVLPAGSVLACGAPV